MMISLPPGFRTLKTSRRSVGKAGHQKCVSTAVMTSKAPSENGNRETEASTGMAQPVPLKALHSCHKEALKQTQAETAEKALPQEVQKRRQGFGHLRPSPGA
jgi:hypothetical protein